jgi:pilus assembly protein CpaB
MNKSRLLILLIAVAAGGAAFFLMSSQTPQQNVLSAAVPKSDDLDVVRVLTASGDIPQGAVIDPKAIRWIKWPRKDVPSFYVTEDNVRFVEELSTMRARIAIRENEPIYENNTVRHGDRGMLAAIMTPGMRAVTAKLAPEQVSGGFVLPGDRVDVFATGVDPEDQNGRAKTWTVLADIRVLAIDQTYDAEDQNAIVGRTVTLELAPEQVRSFIEARDNQTLTLVLRSVFDSGSLGTVEQTSPDQVVVIRYGQG